MASKYYATQQDYDRISRQIEALIVAVDNAALDLVDPGQDPEDHTYAKLADRASAFFWNQPVIDFNQVRADGSLYKKEGDKWAVLLDWLDSLQVAMEAVAPSAAAVEAWLEDVGNGMAEVTTSVWDYEDYE
jgi:hypothetical protein